MDIPQHYIDPSDMDDIARDPNDDSWLTDVATLEDFEPLAELADARPGVAPTTFQIALDATMREAMRLMWEAEARTGVPHAYEPHPTIASTLVLVPRGKAWSGT